MQCNKTNVNITKITVFMYVFILRTRQLHPLTRHINVTHFFKARQKVIIAWKIDFSKHMLNMQQYPNRMKNVKDDY